MRRERGAVDDGIGQASVAINVQCAVHAAGMYNVCMRGNMRNAEYRFGMAIGLGSEVRVSVMARVWAECLKTAHHTAHHKFMGITVPHITLRGRQDRISLCIGLPTHVLFVSITVVYSV